MSYGTFSKSCELLRHAFGTAVGAGIIAVGISGIATQTPIGIGLGSVVGLYGLDVFQGNFRGVWSRVSRWGEDQNVTSDIHCFTHEVIKNMDPSVFLFLSLWGE